LVEFPPEMPIRSYLLWFIGSIILLVVYFILRFWARRFENPLQQKLLIQLSNIMLAASLWSLALIFFRYEMIPALSNNLAVIISLFLLLVWLIWIIIYYFKHIAAETYKFQRQKIKERYLVKKSRRK